MSVYPLWMKSRKGGPSSKAVTAEESQIAEKLEANQAQLKQIEEESILAQPWKCGF